MDRVTDRPYVQPASREIDAGGPVFVADYGGPDGAPLLVAVHGLGGSHLNWMAVAPYLTERYRLVAVDLVGHGRTPSAGRTPDVAGHVAMVERSLGQLSDRPVVLMGSSLGGLVSALCAARSPTGWPAWYWWTRPCPPDGSVLSNPGSCPTWWCA